MESFKNILIIMYLNINLINFYKSKTIFLIYQYNYKYSNISSKFYKNFK